MRPPLTRECDSHFTFRCLGTYLAISRRGWRLRRWMRRPLEERIAIEARRVQADLGISALAALAAAEAVELGREHGLRFDHVQYDNELMRWTGHYEVGPVRCPGQLSLPLSHATEATQRGIATLN